MNQQKIVKDVIYYKNSMEQLLDRKILPEPLADGRHLDGFRYRGRPRLHKISGPTEADLESAKKTRALIFERKRQELEELKRQEEHFLKMIINPEHKEQQALRKMEALAEEALRIIEEMIAIEKKQTLFDKLLKRKLPPEYAELKNHLNYIEKKLLDLNEQRMNPKIVVDIKASEPLKAVRKKIADLETDMKYFYN